MWFRPVTCQLRHSIVVHPVLKKVLDPPLGPKYTEGLAKLEHIVAETWSLVMYPGEAKLAGNKQKLLLPR